MTPELVLVRQLRDIIRGLNSSRGFNWDLVGDAYTTVEGYNLDVGELGTQLHEAYEAQSTKQVWRAITMTGWDCWGDLAQPLARHGDQAYLIDESTDRRLMLRAGLDFPIFPAESLLCAFHWPRVFYSERAAAVSGKDVRSLMFSVMWPRRLNALAHEQRVLQDRNWQVDGRGSAVSWRSIGNRIPIGPRPWETAMLSILSIYRELPKITAFAAVMLRAV